MTSKLVSFVLVSLISIHELPAQLTWQKFDSLYQPLPPTIHVYFTNSPLDSGRFRAYYVEADLKDKDLLFTTDTTFQRRQTPSQFHARNVNSLVVVNTTFFSFATNQNLNLVIKDGVIVSYNIHTINGRGKDTFTYRHPFVGAIGIGRNRKPDIAWTFTDSTRKYPLASQDIHRPIHDSSAHISYERVRGLKYSLRLHRNKKKDFKRSFFPWRKETAVAGGPVILQNGIIRVTNEQELKFTGRAINDKHPRTAMGYTKDGKLIILVVEGRNPNAGGATLTQLAQIFNDLGCWEALNLDGGGSSCLLVNGKETIKVSDATGQRPVPAVFIISSKATKDRKGAEIR